MSNVIFINCYRGISIIQDILRGHHGWPEGRKFWRSATQDPKIQAILLKGVLKMKFSELPYKTYIFQVFQGLLELSVSMLRTKRARRQCQYRMKYIYTKKLIKNKCRPSGRKIFEILKHKAMKLDLLHFLLSCPKKLDHPPKPSKNFGTSPPPRILHPLVDTFWPLPSN